jgi:hypothetical protein
MNGVASAFLAIPEIVVLGLAATGVGRRLLGRGIPEASSLERTALGFPVGMGLLSLLVTILLFSRVPAAALGPILAAGVVGAGAWAREDVGAALRELRGALRESPVLAVAVGTAALLGLIGCLAPETGWDTGVYHFTMSRLRAEQGAMVVRQDIPHGYRPAYMEMLYTAGFAVNGETLASLINASFYFSGLAIARLWGITAGGARGGLYAALAWFTSVTFALRLDGGDVEVGLAVYLGVALYALIRLRAGGSGAWRILAGGGLGLFLGMKYASAYPLILISAAWLVLRLRDRTAMKTLAADAVVIGVLGLAVAAPWYVRNYLETGRPYFPYQAGGVAAWREHDEVSRAGTRALVQALAMDAFILAGLAGLLVSAAARFRWTAAVSVGTALWMIRQQGYDPASISNVMRYTSPCWLPLLVLGGLAVAAAVERGGVRRAAALGVLAVGLALGQGVLAVRNLKKLPVAIGATDRDAYLESRVSTYRAIRDAEAGLAPGKRLLLVEERSYYCRAPFLTASDIQSAVDFSVMKSAAEVRRFLEREAIGAIVVDRSPNAKIWGFRNLESRLGGAWPPPGVRPVETRGDASLYRVE